MAVVRLRSLASSMSMVRSDKSTNGVARVTLRNAPYKIAIALMFIEWVASLERRLESSCDRTLAEWEQPTLCQFLEMFAASLPRW